MCSVSMVMDSKTDDWFRRYYQPNMPGEPIAPLPPMPTPLEIDEFRRLLDRAREYDRRAGREGCELLEKRERLKKLAEDLGLAIDFV